MSWCVDRGTIEVSPLAGLKPPTKETARDRVLTNVEVLACWSGAEAEGYPFEQFTKLLILTGQRRGEVSGMRIMVELDGIAHEFDTSILIVRHLRNAKADNVMHQAIGSIAISARVRSGLISGVHPDDAEKRVIAHAKANYSQPGPAIVFEIDGSKGGRAPVVKWHRPDPNISAEDLLYRQEREPGRPATEREVAKEFLEKELANRVMPKEKLLRMASMRDIAPETLRRAADELEVVKEPGQGRIWNWKLP